jgi:hypothetical protein
MAASSSSTPLFGIREEDQNQMKQQLAFLHVDVIYSSSSSSISPEGKEKPTARNTMQVSNNF